jgi:hypothetical protein
MRIFHHIIGRRKSDRRADASRQRGAQTLLLNLVFRGCQSHDDISSSFPSISAAALGDE